MIKGGSFSESGSASISGSGVMIYIAGSAYPATGGTYGGVALSGAGTVQLTAPSTALYAGILFFEVRHRSDRDLDQRHVAMTLGGVIYASDALLAASGSGSVVTEGMVVNRIQLSGSAVLARRPACGAQSVSVAATASTSAGLMSGPPLRRPPKPSQPPDTVLNELVAALLSSTNVDAFPCRRAGNSQSNTVSIARAGQVRVRSAKSNQTSLPAGPLARLERPRQTSKT